MQNVHKGNPRQPDVHGVESPPVTDPEPEAAATRESFGPEMFPKGVGRDLLHFVQDFLGDLRRAPSQRSCRLWAYDERHDAMLAIS